MLRSLFSLATAASTVAGAVIWDGRFNDMSSVTSLNTWSFSNEVGPYQYYIHGSGVITEYLNLATGYKNPADTVSNQGLKLTIDNTSFWNGQTMRRTELIPQTTAPINKGKVWYHFSMMHMTTNPPSINLEHQVCFFESHFTEMKAGWINGEAGVSAPNLQWMVNGVSQWKVTFDAGIWHNIAYEIDFNANTVAYWHSTGASPLTLTVPAVSVSTSSNGADWHLGVLRLPVAAYPSDGPEDWYYSGVYIESGSLTTTVSGPPFLGVAVPVSSSASPASATSIASSTGSTLATSTKTSSAAAASSTAPTVAGSPHYGQCGGITWTGPTTCVSPYKCVANGAYYSQCL